MHHRVFDPLEQTLATSPSVWDGEVAKVCSSKTSMYKSSTIGKPGFPSVLLYGVECSVVLKVCGSQDEIQKIALLDTIVTREPDGKMHTSVTESPHTDQYLAYYSHHPQSVKRGFVRCLHNRAKRIITKPSGTTQERKHLSTVLVANGCAFSFL